MDVERLADDLAVVRRLLVADVLAGVIRRTDTDLTVTQLATLNLLRGVPPLTVKELAERLGRSLSATSRLVEQLARRGWVSRVEDSQDRRARRISLTDAGVAFLRGFEVTRAEAQLDLMADLGDADRQFILEAMSLLANAARRRAETAQQTDNRTDLNSGEHEEAAK